jgi:hypothetical protein
VKLGKIVRTAIVVVWACCWALFFGANIAAANWRPHHLDTAHGFTESTKTFSNLAFLSPAEKDAYNALVGAVFASTLLFIGAGVVAQATRNGADKPA